MKNVNIIGLDLAKSIFQLHGSRSDGFIVFRMKLTRSKFLSVFASAPRCVVAMEACASLRHWGREIRALGHEVHLIAPIYLKPFVERNNNDAINAQAIAEAASRPTMRFVAVEQRDVGLDHDLQSSRSAGAPRDSIHQRAARSHG